MLDGTVNINTTPLHHLAFQISYSILRLYASGLWSLQVVLLDHRNVPECCEIIFLLALTCCCNMNGASVLKEVQQLFLFSPPHSFWVNGSLCWANQ